MKLRNKKTGEIIELKIRQVNDKYLIDREVDYLDGEKLTLKMLFDAFDDVADTYIKDKDVLEAVRVWGEANHLVEVLYDKDKDCIYSPYGSDKTDTSVSISFDDCNVFKGLEHRKLYTLNELVGE